MLRCCGEGGGGGKGSGVNSISAGGGSHHHHLYFPYNLLQGNPGCGNCPYKVYISLQ